MLRNLSVLVVVALIGVTGAYAQDWGTDADTVIYLLGNDGTIDQAGEGGLTVGAALPLSPPEPGSTMVTAVYNMGLIGTNMDKPAMPGDTLWMPYFIKNMSNTTDSINISAVISATNMDVVNALIASDEEGDTMINLMGTDFIASTTGNYGLWLAEDAEKIIFIGAVVPDTAIDGDTAVYDITVDGNQGSGTDDLWPSNYPAYTLASDNGDQQLDMFVVSVGMPVITYATMASKTTAVPGDTIMYTLMYDNDGSDSTDVANGGQLYITQLLPQYVTYVSGTFDYASVHTNANATPMFSSVMAPVSFVQGEAWANSYPDSVAGFQVMFGNDIQGQENSEGTDSVGVADGDMPDDDAGQVTFKVIVK